MLRTTLLAALLVVLPWPIAGQALSVLRIKIAVTDADGTAMPVPRHVLFISDNPASDVPRRVVTTLDGTVEVRLRPGNYTVESDKPVAFQGKSYRWTQTLDVAAGRETVLELTIGNAEVETDTPAATGAASGPATDPSISLPRWFDSVVAIWTPYVRASGFVVDAAGLIVTSRRIVGAETSVEVQLTPSIKVAARVIESDPARDVAVLRIDPQVVASLRPLPLGCAPAPRPSVVYEQEIWALGAPLRGPKRITSGVVSRIEPRAITSDARLANGSAGGPVFTADGTLIGITTLITDEETDDGRSRVVRIEDACESLASAAKKVKDSAPAGAHLPVEPIRPFPADALKSAAQSRKGSVTAYQISSSDFDVAFITPVLTYTAQYQEESRRGRTTSATLAGLEGQLATRTLLDFGAWSDYVSDFPPVLLVRATPKFEEGFWTMVARGAARTQGMSLPPIKRFKSGFARMTALCGDTEVVPIHPFKIQQRISDTTEITEGLYAFDPGALGPHCGTVTLVLYSEKDPAKADRRIVDAAVLEQIAKDFAPYRKP